MPAKDPLKKAADALLDFARAYPETTEDMPWGHNAIKIKGKAFLFLSMEGKELSLSVKLPSSNLAALMLPFAEPTGYGLGKSGWVTATFSGRKTIPVGLLKEWIDESFRAIAPKRMVKAMDARD